MNHKKANKSDLYITVILLILPLILATFINTGIEFIFFISWILAGYFGFKETGVTTHGSIKDATYVHKSTILDIILGYIPIIGILTIMILGVLAIFK